MNALLRYRLIIFYVVLFSANALATAALAGLSGKDLSKLTATEWVIIALAILANWTNALLAFANKAWSKLEDKTNETKPPTP